MVEEGWWRRDQLLHPPTLRGVQTCTDRLTQPGWVMLVVMVTQTRLSVSHDGSVYNISITRSWHEYEDTFQFVMRNNWCNSAPTHLNQRHNKTGAVKVSGLLWLVTVLLIHPDDFEIIKILDPQNICEGSGFVSIYVVNYSELMKVSRPTIKLTSLPHRGTHRGTMTFNKCIKFDLEQFYMSSVMIFFVLNFHHDRVLELNISRHNCIICLIVGGFTLIFHFNSNHDDSTKSLIL